MTKDQWAWTLRKAAAKANPVFAAALRKLATRNDQEDESEGNWIAGPAREPGQEG